MQHVRDFKFKHISRFPSTDGAERIKLFCAKKILFALTNCEHYYFLIQFISYKNLFVNHATFFNRGLKFLSSIKKVKYFKLREP